MAIEDYITNNIQKYGGTINGAIIGDVTPFRGCLYYDGRPQGQPFWAESDKTLKEIAENMIEELKDQSGEAFTMIYPKHKTHFELRIWDA